MKIQFYHSSLIFYIMNNKYVHNKGLIRKSKKLENSYKERLKNVFFLIGFGFSFFEKSHHKVEYCLRLKIALKIRENYKRLAKCLTETFD